jgi:methylphosphotriester-DNA--protein-cysteine methyltransferase
MDPRGLVSQAIACGIVGSACAAAGVSVRTLERIFRREVGTNLETGRRQVRLMKAIELLFSGSSVKEAAFAVGYQQSNSLVGLFRRMLATTPKAWISALARSHSAESSQARGRSRRASAAGKLVRRTRSAHPPFKTRRS